MKKAVWGALCILAGVVFAEVSAVPAGWQYRMKINLNTTASGASVNGNVEKFPLAIQFTESTFDFSRARTDGADIRFTDEQDNSLAHEIEYWNSTAKKAAIWVLIPVVKGNSNDQFIYCYCGNSDAQSTASSSDVFARADGWVGVWHLSEETSSDQDGFKDATANQAHATGVNFSGGQSVDGRIGRCPQFRHQDRRHIKIANDKRKLFDLTRNITFSIWVNAQSYPEAYITMFSKGDDSWRVQMFGIYTWGSHNGRYISEMCVESNNADYCLEYWDGELFPNQWHHLTVVHDYPRVHYYINGNVMSRDMGGTWRSGDDPVGIGYQSQFNSRFWDGLMDEARVLEVSKNADWVTLDYNSQKPDQKLASYGPLEELQSSRAVSLLDYRSAFNAPVERVEVFGVNGRLLRTLHAGQLDNRGEFANMPQGVYLARWYFRDNTSKFRTLQVSR